MKRPVLIGLALFLIVIAFPVPATAQDGEDCDPDAVLEWLIERQAWRNATGDVLESGIPVTQARFFLYEHVEAIADLDRPQCADEAMLWTYFFYDAVGHYYLCFSENQTECVAAMDARIATYREEVERAFEPLETLTGFDPAAYLDLRPEDWSGYFVIQDGSSYDVELPPAS